MPTYTYRCPKCGRTKDAVVPVADRDKWGVVLCCTETFGAFTTGTPTQRQVDAPAVRVVGGTPRHYPGRR